MTDGPITVLLTRPADQSARFAQEFTARFGTGFDVICDPILKILPKNASLDLQSVGGVILTSRHAVGILGAAGGDGRKPAYCVGNKTAQAARDLGHPVALVAPDAAHLVAAILADPPGGRLIHLRGAHSRGEIAATLTAAGQPCDEQVLYDQVAQDLSQEG